MGYQVIVQSGKDLRDINYWIALNSTENKLLSRTSIHSKYSTLSTIVHPIRNVIEIIAQFK